MPGIIAASRAGKLTVLLTLLATVASPAWAQRASQSARPARKAQKQHKRKNQARQARAGRKAQAQPSEPIVLPEGPMRIEPLTLIEMRIWDAKPELKRRFRPSLRLQVQITGAKLPQLVRAGKLIIEQAQTDNGEVLKPNPPYKPRDLTATQNVYITDRTLRQGFLPREVTLNVPSRQATKIATCRGYINLAYASATLEVEVRDPLAWQGKLIDHPLLKQYGIKVRVLKLGEETEEPPDGRGIALRFEEGKDLIRAINFYDGWFRRFQARGRRHEPEDGHPGYSYYAAQRGRIDHDTTMVLTIFSDLTTQKLEFNLTDLPLP